jgi:hypothetical protein
VSDPHHTDIVIDVARPVVIARSLLPVAPPKTRLDDTEFGNVNSGPCRKETVREEKQRSGSVLQPGML